jgi:hypothetical protein
VKRYRVFHFCGCIMTYGRPWQGPSGDAGWRIVGFEQRCDRRWRFGHFGLTREQEAAQEAADEGPEYSIELFDRTGESFAGQSVIAADDAAASDEARSFALEHAHAVRARVRCKEDGHTWFVEVR